MKSLKDIITNDNVPVDFQLFDDTFTVSADRNVYNELRKKYLIYAESAFKRFMAVDNSFKKLDDLVKKTDTVFKQLLMKALEEVLRDAFSVGILTSDINTLYKEYYDSGLMDQYKNTYTTYADFYYDAKEQLQANKEYRRDLDHRSNMSASLHGYNSSSSIMNDAIERAFINASEKREVKREFKSAFNDTQMRNDLRNGVRNAILNLHLYIINYFPQKTDIKLGGLISNKAYNTAVSALNNIENQMLTTDQKKEITKIILENDPYLDNAYPVFSNCFPDQIKQFVILGDYFGISSIIRKVNNDMLTFVKSNIGITEADLENCKSLFEQKLEEVGLSKESATPVYAFIQERGKQLDLEYRTVEGAVFNTRKEADSARESIALNEHMLKKPRSEFIRRSDFLDHIQALKDLSVPQPILNNYISLYEQRLNEFDKKCKIAALYEESLNGNSRSIKNRLSSLVTSVEEQRSTWEDITYNGKYSLEDIIGSNDVLDKKNSTDKVDNSGLDTDFNNNIPEELTISADTAIDFSDNSSENQIEISNGIEKADRNSSVYLNNSPIGITEKSEGKDETNKTNHTGSSPKHHEKNSNETRNQTSVITENNQYEEKKKSPIVWILAGIIGLLILGIGILGSMLLMKDKHGNGSDINDISVNSTTVIEQPEEITTTKVVTSVTETQPPTTTIVETTAVASTSLAVSDEQFNSAVDSFISSYGSDSNDPVKDTQYSLYDVNGDGIKELFIKAEHIAGNYTHMYLYKNGSFSSTDVSGENIRFTVTDNLIESLSSGGGIRYAYYRINADNTVELIEQIISYAGQYSHDDQNISENEFNTLIADKNNFSWVSPSYTYFTPQIQTENQLINIPDSYSDFPNIENVSSDMTFYEGSELSYGRIMTESSGLNLRKGPGTSYDVIKELPKGEVVWIFGENSEWYYVGVNGDGNRYVYTDVGFVSKQYVSIIN